MTDYKKVFDISNEKIKKLEKEDIIVLDMASLNLNFYSLKFPKLIKPIVYNSDFSKSDNHFKFSSSDKNDTTTNYVAWYLTFCTHWLIAIRYQRKNNFFDIFKASVNKDRTDIENAIINKYNLEYINAEKELFYKKYKGLTPLGFLNPEDEEGFLNFTNLECDIVLTTPVLK